MGKYDELKRLAEAATPGPWGTDGEYINEHGNLLFCHIGVPGEGRLADAASNCMVSDEKCRANASYIAAANPATVLALIAENETLRSSGGFNELALLRMGYRQACEERDRLKAELERARVDAERLRKHLAECSDSLESEILDRYGSSKDHPAMRSKFERDMQEVIDARAAMGKGGAQNGTKTAETRAATGLEGGVHGENSGGAENCLKTDETREIDGAEGGAE
ncbi:ead/Ea22-like family protein [Azotobacter salinestris]|uniref:ead/Ea22-like family protein n=1 Tax=Azotobacter salinestris TaxID=69964 RepID=UPI0032DFF418